MDASINISMEPFRAFVADMLPDDQRSQGFAMQSFFIGIGSVAASFLPWLLGRFFTPVTGTLTGVPPIVRLSFWTGAVAFIGAVLWTVLTTREYPPSAHERERLKTAKRFDLDSIVHALREMPGTMRQLAVVQLLTWLGLFCMFLYFAVAVAHNVFGAKSTTEAAYTQGVVWAGYCSGVYNAVCFLFAPMLPLLTRRIGKKNTHSICLLCGAIGLLSVSLIHNQWLLFLPMVGVGIAWASILAMPYSILAGALPSNKMGIYMGIFNFFIVIPEILSSLVFGWLMVHALGNDRMKALIVGGAAMLLAGVLMQRVKEVVIQDESIVPVILAEPSQA